MSKLELKMSRCRALRKYVHQLPDEQSRMAIHTEAGEKDALSMCFDQYN